MNAKKINRTAAAAAIAALLAAGAGVAAIGTGAIALDGSAAGATIVNHEPGKVSIQLTADETSRVAYQNGYATTVCTDPWLPNNTAPCVASIKPCATAHASARVPVLVTLTKLGSLLTCEVYTRG